MNKIKSKVAAAQVKAHCLILGAKARLTDTSGEGHVDTAVKIIIGVVIGALVLAGLVILWNTVIMPRLTGEINNMFG
jgi:succinate dehydrogenase hydrophobic anchor subunit